MSSHTNCRVGLLIIGTLLLPVTTVIAQEQEYASPSLAGVIDAYFRASAPVEEHELLSQLKGVWQVELATDFGSFAALTLTAQMVMDGKYLQEVVSGRLDDRRVEALGLTGFNKTTRMFESIWVDNISGSTLLLAGSALNENRSLVLQGEYADPVTNGTRYLRVIRAIDATDTQELAWYELVGVAAEAAPQAGQRELEAPRLLFHVHLARLNEPN